MTFSTPTRPSRAASLAGMTDEQLATRARGGDHRAREALILRHRRLVGRLARDFRASGFPDEDLRQAGTVGLILAVDRFRPEKGARFVTYACVTIRGELQHLLRDHGWAVRVSRPVQDLGRRAAAEQARLSQRLGRPPATDELARSLDETADAVDEALQARAAYRAAPIAAEDDATQGPGALDAGFERAELTADLAAALAGLPLRERRILALRFQGDMSQRLIARELGISQMHVSRLLRAALETLREGMAGESPARLLSAGGEGV
jgi:RNA polymerase sigma-B factor